MNFRNYLVQDLAVKLQIVDGNDVKNQTDIPPTGYRTPGSKKASNETINETSNENFEFPYVPETPNSERLSKWILISLILIIILFLIIFFIWKLRKKEKEMKKDKKMK